MQFLVTHIFNTLPRMVAVLLAVAMLLNIAAVAQPATDSLRAATDSTNITSGNGRASVPAIITNFTQFDMPGEMANAFMRLSPKGILLYHDEFQVTHDGVDGLEILVTKVWYIDDHIVGYVIRTPLEKAGAKINKSKVDIPVTWVCTPAIQGHEEHSARSLAELRNDEASYKCTGWHIQLPEELTPQPQYSQRLKKGQRLQPVAGGFGQAEKTSDKPKPAKKKKGKQQGFEQAEDAAPAADSTQVPKQP